MKNNSVACIALTESTTSIAPITCIAAIAQIASILPIESCESIAAVVVTIASDNWKIKLMIIKMTKSEIDNNIIEKSETKKWNKKVKSKNEK